MQRDQSGVVVNLTFQKKNREKKPYTNSIDYESQNRKETVLVVAWETHLSRQVEDELGGRPRRVGGLAQGGVEAHQRRHRLVDTVAGRGRGQPAHLQSSRRR